MAGKMGSNKEWLDSVYDKLLVKMKAECSSRNKHPVHHQQRRNV